MAESLRAPKSLPKCLPLQQQQLLLENQKQAGRGRGRGVLGLQPSQQAPGGLASVAQPVAPAKQNTQQPQQKYIPGLNNPTPEPARTVQKAPNRSGLPGIPAQLVAQFYDNSSKSPISILMEYGAMTGTTVEFQEVAVERKPGYTLTIASYANVCTIGGFRFPQGTGRKKKDAKSEAAKIALTQLIEMAGVNEENEHEEVEDKELQSGSYYTPRSDSKSAEQVGEYGGKSERSGASRADPYDMAGKHPVMMLHEYCSKKRYQLGVVVPEEHTDFGFKAIIYVNEKVVCEGYAGNKKDAKKNAAEEALKVLLAYDKMPLADHTPSHYDKMARLVREKFAELTASYSQWQSGYKFLAAFIMLRSKGGGNDEASVVALGTGDGFITSSALKHDGRCVIDCHAEVLARRSLVKYLYREAKLQYDNRGNPHCSIFSEQQGTYKLRLKPDVTFHMYMSSACCGDARAFSVSETLDNIIISNEEADVISEGMHYPDLTVPAHGQLRYKAAQGQTIPVVRVPSEQTIQQLENNEPVRVMSCSDKLLKWNIVGLQGGLLTNFIEPVYITTITMGNQYVHGHITRAVCCRLDDDIVERLPKGYKHLHPYIGRTTVFEPQHAASLHTQHQLSINWCTVDPKIEVLDGTRGTSIAESPFKTGAVGASRLCKAGFLHRFRELAAAAKQEKLRTLPCYIDAKKAAADYQQAKLVLTDYLDSSECGRWMNKPPELEQFAK